MTIPAAMQTPLSTLEIRKASLKDAIKQRILILDGGMGTMIGPVIGAILLFGIPEHNPVLPSTVPRPVESYGHAKLAAEWAYKPKASGHRPHAMHAYEKGIIWGNDNYLIQSALVDSGYWTEEEVASGQAD